MIPPRCVKPFYIVCVLLYFADDYNNVLAPCIRTIIFKIVFNYMTYFKQYLFFAFEWKFILKENKSLQIIFVC